MKKRTIYIMVLSFLMAFSSCSNKSATTSEDDHTVALTRWSEKLEVFMEYPVPIPGQEVRFGVHLTDLSDFKPIIDGTLELEFITPGSSQKTSAKAEQPIREGIFTPVHTFDRPGDYEFILILNSSKVSDRMNLGTLTVYESLPAEEEEDKSSVDEVPFLKEQQWKIDFRIEPAGEHTISQTIKVPGKIIPAAYKMAKISPPLNGKIIIDRNIKLPKQGDMVQAGSILAVIAPSLASFSSSNEYQIDLEVENTKTKLILAENEAERLKKLFEKDAVPKRRLLEAEAALEIAISNQKKALEKKKAFQRIKLQPGGNNQNSYYFIRSPIAGRIVDMKYTLGEQVRTSDIIMTILEDSTVWLETSIFEEDINKIRTSTGGYFTPAGSEKTYKISQYDGRQVFFGSVIDENTRTIKVIHEITNPSREFFVGSFVTAYLNTAEKVEALSIPKTAVFESGGRQVCFIQLDGETFEKRAITLGVIGQDYVQVLSGLRKDEKVVVIGGYAVKLAAESSDKKVGEGHYH